jgi:hypothetical protein
MPQVDSKADQENRLLQSATMSLLISTCKERRDMKVKDTPDMVTIHLNLPGGHLHNLRIFQATPGQGSWWVAAADKRFVPA